MVGLARTFLKKYCMFATYVTFCLPIVVLVIYSHLPGKLLSPNEQFER